jgi:hypothetical protein
MQDQDGTAMAGTRDMDSVQSTPAIRVPSLLKEWLQSGLAESNEWRCCFRLAKVLPALEFPQFPQALCQSASGNRKDMRVA